MIRERNTGHPADRGAWGGALIAGFVTGVIYFFTNLAWSFPHEQLFLMKGGLMRANLFVYSFSVWVCLFVLLGAAANLAGLPLKLLGRPRLVLALRRFIVFFVLGLALVGGFMVWRAYINTSPNLPLSLKFAAVKQSLVVAGILAGVVSGFLVAAVVAAESRFRRVAPPAFKILVSVVCVCAVYVVFANFVALAGTFRASPEPPRSGRGYPVVILTVDAGSWNVLQPIMVKGSLPALTGFMRTGTYGYLQTHGRQFTPPSWATIATGKREDEHGVHMFDSLSSDWKAASLWSIASALGRTVAVANWMCTWPPFEVNGGFVSGVISHRSGLVYLSQEWKDLMPLAEEIVQPWTVDNQDSEARIVDFAREEAGRVSRIDQQVLSSVSPDLVAYGYYATDKAQHFFWRDMRPELFGQGDWAEVQPRPEYADAIEEVWAGVDGLLSQLMSRYGDNAHYFVISDHGSRPVRKRAVVLDTDALLEAMGFLQRLEGEVDAENSACYTSPWSGELYAYSLEVGADEAAEFEGPERDRYDATRSRVIDALKRLRVVGEDQPIFATVDAVDGASSRDIPDIRATAARVLTEMPDADTRVIVNGESIPLRRFLKFHPWSGRHRPRGIVLAKGPAIRQRYTGAWTVDDPYTRILSYVHGLYGFTEPAFGFLRRLHLVDEVTTIDITPTVLYLSRLPIAEDMHGRVVTRFFDRAFLAENPAEKVETYETGEVLEREEDEEDLEESLKKLKALGYI